MTVSDAPVLGIGTPPTPDKLLRVPAVSELTGIPENTLRQWRHRGYGPVSARLGGRIVYREVEVRRWVAEQFEQTASGGTPAA